MVGCSYWFTVSEETGVKATYFQCQFKLGKPSSLCNSSVVVSKVVNKGTCALVAILCLHKEWSFLCYWLGFCSPVVFVDLSQFSL